MIVVNNVSVQATGAISEHQSVVRQGLLTPEAVVYMKLSRRRLVLSSKDTSGTSGQISTAHLTLKVRSNLL